MSWFLFGVLCVLILFRIFRPFTPPLEGPPPLSTNHQVMVLEAAADWRRWIESGEDHVKRYAVSKMSIVMQNANHGSVRAFAITVGGGQSLYEYIQDLND